MTAQPKSILTVAEARWRAGVRAAPRRSPQKSALLLGLCMMLAGVALILFATRKRADKPTKRPTVVTPIQPVPPEDPRAAEIERIRRSIAEGDELERRNPPQKASV